MKPCLTVRYFLKDLPISTLDRLRAEFIALSIPVVRLKQDLRAEVLIRRDENFSVSVLLPSETGVYHAKG
jgi:hypothetical protein